jgi:hypothetical protein
VIWICWAANPTGPFHRDEWTWSEVGGFARPAGPHLSATEKGFQFFKFVVLARDARYPRDPKADYASAHLGAARRALYDLHFAGFRIEKSDSLMWNTYTSFKGYEYIYVLPYWPIIIASGIPPLRRLTRAVQRADRLRENHCFRCSYNLRGSLGRCPECGTEPRG